MNERNVKCWARIEFFATLPDDDDGADFAFDVILDAIDARLNERPFGAGVVTASFSVPDADSEPDE